MDSFIDQLSSTLNLANLNNNNKNDSEIEDLREEDFEDLEEEAIQAEKIAKKEQQQHNNNNNNNSGLNRPKRTNFFNGSYSNEDEDDDDEDENEVNNMTITKTSRKKPTQANANKDITGLNNINNLGANESMGICEEIDKSIDLEKPQKKKYRKKKIAPRVKFNDIRKITIGMCKKNIMSYRRKDKQAFYNCFVLILRLKMDGLFKECHVKVFNTGKIKIPGIQNDSMFTIILDKIINIIQPFINIPLF
jgi:hypothetical protein